MTTLPQTSTARLARPVSPTPIAVGMGYGPPHGGAGAVEQMTGADVARILRSNLWLIVVMLVLSIAAGAAWHWFSVKYFPSYKAVAQLEVNPSQPTPVRIIDTANTGVGWQDPRMLETELLTQQSSLTSVSLFGEVITHEAVKKTQWYRSFEDRANKEQPLFDAIAALEDLKNNFKAKPALNTRFLLVSMSTPVPGDAKVILDEVVNSYQTDLKERRQKDMETRTTYLRGVRDTRNTDLAGLDDRIRKMETDLNISQVGVSGKLNIKESEIQGLQNKYLEAQIDTQTLESMLATVDKTIHVKGETPAQVESELNRDYELQEYRRQAVAAQLMMQDAESRYGKDHDNYKRAKQNKEYLDGLYALRESDLTKKKNAELVETLTSQKASSEQKAAKWKEEIARVTKEIEGLSKKMSEYQALVDKARELRMQLQQVDDQLVAVANAKGSLPLEWPPGWTNGSILPRIPDNLGPVPTLALAIALGLGLSVGLAFLRELTDTRIRSPRDIARVGPMNLLGLIAEESEDKQATGARLPLVIAEAPHSILAEQLRQMRTRLQHAASLDTTRSLLVTSPGPGDGKSTIATNLAAGLALNGRRILLVDANLRRPELHRIFGVSNERGFSDVLNNLESFDTILQQTHVPNLALLASGPKPANSAELFESQLFVDFLQRALEEYDHVIFDGGPLLFASETVAMAPRVDGVVTVVRARSNSRGVLQRVRETLRQIKAEHLGVVLNAVRAQGGGYYSRNIKTYYSYQNNGH